MANRVDYENLTKAKVNVENKFDEMLTNLENTKNNIVDLTDGSWKGKSSNYFLEVFEEVKAKITKEREEFSRDMQNKLDIWYEEFSEAEKAAIAAAQKME